MMSHLETWIGLRYLRTKKRNGFMSFISIISIVGIALGVITLIVVLSVMNGFQKDVRAKLFKVAPHMEIGFYENSPEQDWHILQQLAQKNQNVVSSMPYIVGQALLAHSGIVQGVQIQGIVPSEYGKMMPDNQDFQANSFDKLQAGKFNLIIGSGVAENLGVQVGDKVSVITPQGNFTPAGIMPRLKQFTVVGIIKSDIFELNHSLVLTNITDAQKLFRLGDRVTGLRIKLRNPQDAPEMTPTFIPAQYQPIIWTRDWSFNNRSYFEAVALEKKMMFIIMALISAVASFNLVSSLVMTVNEKRADIAILRTLGMSPRSIMKIFMVQGAIAGLIGTFAGVVLGVLLAFNVSRIVSFIEHLSGKQLVNSQVYFLNYIPVDIQISDITIIAGISLLLAFLATLYPSWRASKTQPVEALRYE